jgi:4-alpha-glucanotransferase
VTKVYPEMKSITPETGWTPEVHRALLASAESAGSDLCVLPWQDILGTTGRINLPGSAHDSNWSYRIEALCEDLSSTAQTKNAASLIREQTLKGKRQAPGK